MIRNVKRSLLVCCALLAALSSLARLPLLPRASANTPTPPVSPSVTLDTPSSVGTSFVVPNVATATQFTFRLKVSDGKAWASDTVIVKVDPDAVNPTGGAGGALVLSDGGCGCSTVGSPSTNAAAAFSLLGFVGLAFGRLRRRRAD